MVEHLSTTFIFIYSFIINTQREILHEGISVSLSLVLFIPMPIKIYLFYLPVYYGWYWINFSQQSTVDNINDSPFYPSMVLGVYSL